MSQNYAFIDAQNLNSGLYKLGWKIDWKRFREYLREEKWVEIAYVFLGFMLGNQDLYLMLQRSGFVVVFKEILTTESGEVKGNIDAEMILQAMIDYDRYDQALIVSGDGDFTCLLRYLGQNNKLLGVLAPYEKGLSSLIQKFAGDKVEYLRSLRKKIEYRPTREGRSRTKPMPPMKTDTGILETRKIPLKQNRTPIPKSVGRSKTPIGITQEKTEQNTRPKMQNPPEQIKSLPRKGTLYTGGTKDI
ncbi:MAG: RtsE [uncultured bacterium (gcode 4)]|uniref:RtsE n=1 Tax=uncultured bacterium (gcode 4) TaxID=1234023 RepID=K1XYQ6_9BACT|nr:MAG: RtsE [uncultured bacterium (gcode 4)]